MKSILTVFLTLLPNLYKQFSQPTGQTIFVQPQAQPVFNNNQCFQIPGLGNPVVLMKVLFEQVNMSLQQKSNIAVSLIYQENRNGNWYFVFKFDFQPCGYTGILYQDSVGKGRIITQVYSEMLEVVNIALGVRCLDNNVLVCPNIKCFWAGNCNNQTIIQRPIQPPPQQYIP